MKETEEKVKDILASLSPLLEAHDCSMELSAVKDRKVFIYCGGQGAVCDNKCVEEVLREKIPDLEIVFL